MIPTTIGDVRCPFCLTEFETKDGISAGDQLVDHLTDDHDHFRIDAEDTCPLCAAQFDDDDDGPSAAAKLTDHLSSEHEVYGRALRAGLAGGV